MRIVLFCHSLLSDWNHGNAHFLRGIATELRLQGHDVLCVEPRTGWSVSNLVRDHGPAALRAALPVYPHLTIYRYDGMPPLDRVLDGAQLVLVHEWNDAPLVQAIGEYRKRQRGMRLLFHDTHHRSVTSPMSETHPRPRSSIPLAMGQYDLRNYDGVLAFGEVIRTIYLQRGWAERAWTWHEAADIRVFRPRGLHARHAARGSASPNGTGDDTALDVADTPRGDLVWVGNWGDEERTSELREFLLEPATQLDLRTAVYGVRYPAYARAALQWTGIAYRGWLPNFRVPEVFGNHRVTVHIPRRPYVRALPGIPTIRVFEALACGIPLVSTAWEDAEGLFRPGVDYLTARNGQHMRAQLKNVLHDADAARELSHNGLQTIRQRHTCAHRAAELLAIYGALEGRREWRDDKTWR